VSLATLVINARDDTTSAPYRIAAEAAARIPGAKLGAWTAPDAEAHDLPIAVTTEDHRHHDPCQARLGNRR
jgi:hypothetical protein